MNDLLAGIDGRKTYLAALGLVVLAVVQFQSKQYEQAAQSILAALAAAGIRHAVDKTKPQSPTVPAQPDGGANTNP